MPEEPGQITFARVFTGATLIFIASICRHLSLEEASHC
jgi:hypothetical protein